MLEIKYIREGYQKRYNNKENKIEQKEQISIQDHAVKKWQ